MHLHILRSFEFENHIFSGWTVFMSMRVCAISITEKQITAESSNLAFYIYIICRYYLKLFSKDRTKSLFTETLKRILLD